MGYDDIVYTAEDGITYTQRQIDQIIANMDVVEVLGYLPSEFNSKQYALIFTVLTKYAIELANWQHIETVFSELIDDDDEQIAVRELIEEVLEKYFDDGV